MANQLERFTIDIIVENEGRLHYGRKRNGIVERENDSLIFSGSTNLCPIPKNVKTGVAYGDQIGTLGKINGNALDIAKSMKDNLLTLIEDYIGWNRLAYMNELELNSLKQNVQAFGVQIGDLNESEGTTVREIARTFKVILRDAYKPKGKTDQLREKVADDIRTKMEEIRRRCDETNGGSYNNVMGTDNYNEIEVVFEDSEDGAKVVTCELEFDIIYSVNNK